jgi:hypothetical protein
VIVAAKRNHPLFFRSDNTTIRKDWQVEACFMLSLLMSFFDVVGSAINYFRGFIKDTMTSQSARRCELDPPELLCQ